MTDARDPSERIRVLRELGIPPGQGISMCAALETGADGRPRLVVAECVARGAGVDDGEIAAWLGVARSLAPLEHPNVARVRAVTEGASECMVVTDFIDGVRWSELASGSGMSLEIALRVLLDVLAGLGALHNVRDAKRQPLKLVHGGLTSDAVVVGLDGVGRVVGMSRVRSAAARAGLGSHFLAPEVLLEDDTADVRADVYSVGVLLWEALTRRPLFMDSQASAIVTAVLSGRVPRAEVPAGATWAAPLVDVAARALSADPPKRYASATAMAAEIRRIAGAKLVPSIRVAAVVRSAFGDRIKARREELERGEVQIRAASGTAAAGPVVPAEADGPSSTAPTPVPPPPNATTRPPPPLASTAEATPVRAPVQAPLPSLDGPISLSPVSVQSGDSIPVAVSTSSAPGSDERVTDPVPPAPAAAAAAQPPVPPAPPVPRELREPTPEPVPAAKPLPPSASPLTLEPAVFAAAVPPPRGRKNPRLVAVLALGGPLVLAIAGAAVWLASGDAPKAKAPAPTVASAAAPTAPAAETASAPVEPAAPAPPVAAAAASTAAPAATAPAAAIETPTAESAIPTPTPAPLPAEAPPKPRPVIKYDPQGI